MGVGSKSGSRGQIGVKGEGCSVWHVPDVATVQGERTLKVSRAGPAADLVKSCSRNPGILLIPQRPRSSSFSDESPASGLSSSRICDTAARMLSDTSNRLVVTGMLRGMVRSPRALQSTTSGVEQSQRSQASVSVVKLRQVENSVVRVSLDAVALKVWPSSTAVTAAT